MRTARAYGFLGAIWLGSVWISFLIISEIYFNSTHPWPDLFGWFGYWMAWPESLVFLGMGISIGVIVGLLFAWPCRRDESTSAAPILVNRTARVYLVLALLAALAGTSMVLPRVRVTVLGWFRGETCHKGLPESYWVAELRLVALTLEGRGWPGQDLQINHLIVFLAKHVGAEAGPGVAALLDDPSIHVRDVAIQTLSRIGEEAPEAMPISILIGAFEKENEKQSWTLAGNLADCLGELGPAAKDAIPVLVNSLGSKSLNVREHSARVLKKIDLEEAKKAGVR